MIHTCEEVPDIYTQIYYDPNGWDDKPHWVLRDSMEDVSFHIKYCPFCGVELSKEEQS